jgi:hypothetical protein
MSSTARVYLTGHKLTRRSSSIVPWDISGLAGWYSLLRDGRPTPDPAAYRALLPRLKDAWEAIITITTGGVGSRAQRCMQSSDARGPRHAREDRQDAEGLAQQRMTCQVRGASPARSRSHDLFGCRNDIRVQPEEVVRIVLRLDESQPSEIHPVRRCGKGLGGLVHLSGEIRVGCPGRVRRDLIEALANPGDVSLVILSAFPGTVDRGHPSADRSAYAVSAGLIALTAPPIWKVTTCVRGEGRAFPLEARMSTASSGRLGRFCAFQ